MLRRLTVLTLVLGLLVGACGDDDAGDDNAAVTSLPDDDTTTTTSTTEPQTVAPDVIPQDESLITEEYVEGVLADLFKASGDAIRHSVAAGEITDESIAMFDAVFTTTASVVQINNLADAAAEGFQRYHPQPGDVAVAIVDLQMAQGDCIVAEVTLDSSEVLVDPPSTEDLRSFIALRPATEEQRSSALNPTAWAIHDTEATFDGSEAAVDCA